MPFTEKYIRPLAVAVIRYQGKILAVRGVDHVKNEVCPAAASNSEKRRKRL